LKVGPETDASRESGKGEASEGRSLTAPPFARLSKENRGFAARGAAPGEITESLILLLQPAAGGETMILERIYIIGSIASVASLVLTIRRRR
jgi:hypothetical protein